jgi:hypothetical protein
MGQYLNAQILNSDKHISGWHAAARALPGAANSGSDDSTGYNISREPRQGADSRHKAAHNCVEERYGPDPQNRERKIQLRPGDEDGAEDGRNL